MEEIAVQITPKWRNASLFAVQVAPSVKLVTGGLSAGKLPGRGAGASQAPSHVFGVPVHEQGKAASSNAVPRTQQASVQQDKVRLLFFYMHLGRDVKMHLIIYIIYYFVRVLRQTLAGVYLYKFEGQKKSGILELGRNSLKCCL